MVMTSVLANNLMDDLCCLSISASGVIPEDEEQMKPHLEYARKTFMEITDFFQDKYGDEWVITANDEDSEEETEEEILK